MKLSLAIVMLCIAGSAWAADEQDAQSIGAERARLGNARIQQDMERRAREEENRVTAAQSESVSVQEAAPAVQQTSVAPTVVAAQQPPPPSAPVSPRSSSITETLELLQKLGELKDAGYVTEDEYNKLKQKVLADEF